MGDNFFFSIQHLFQSDTIFINILKTVMAQFVVCRYHTRYYCRLIVRFLHNDVWLFETMETDCLPIDKSIQLNTAFIGKPHIWQKFCATARSFITPFTEFIFKYNKWILWARARVSKAYRLNSALFNHYQVKLYSSFNLYVFTIITIDKHSRGAHVCHGLLTFSSLSSRILNIIWIIFFMTNLNIRVVLELIHSSQSH